jgi:hypothetical protein
MTTLRHEVIESVNHRVIGKPGIRRFGYPVRKIAAEAVCRVFESLIFHIFKLFVS